MLEIKNVTITKEGQAVNNNCTYTVHYNIVNNLITSVQCVVDRLVDGMQEQLGYIRREGGRVNTDFMENVPLTEYLTFFEKLVKEIEKEVKAG